MDRIAAIRSSLFVFVCGLFGLIPLLGMLPALCALVGWGRVRTRYSDWNPAARYLDWGAKLAAFGLMLSTLIGFAVVIAAGDSLFR